MGSYTVEQVEFLRQRADITYEEALEVLERCNGDLTRCLVDLERRGLIRKGRTEGAGRANSTQSRTRTANTHARNASGATLGSMLKKLAHMRLVVAKEKRTYVDLPVIYLILAVLFAPHLMIATVIAMFVMGLKIRLDSGDGTNVGNDEFYDIVDKAADNIKTTVTSFARAAREGSEKTHRENVEKHTPYAATADQENYEEQVNTAKAYEQPAPQTVPPQADAPDVEIPNVTRYEDFTGTETADDGDENEFTIG